MQDCGQLESPADSVVVFLVYKVAVRQGAHDACKLHMLLESPFVLDQGCNVGQVLAACGCGCAVGVE